MLEIFTQHQLAAGGFNVDKVPPLDPWPTILLCAALFLFTLIVIHFRRKIFLLFRSLYSARHFSLMLREGKILQERFFLFTLLFDVMVFALGLMVVARHYHNVFAMKCSVPLLFAILFGALMVLYWLKFLGNFIYVTLFEHPKELYPMNLYKFIFVTDAAVLMFPFLVVVVFTGVFAFFYVYISVFLILFVIFLYKLMKINPGKINLFNFFIYFCTLEILPYLLLAKLTVMI